MLNKKLYLAIMTSLFVAMSFAGVYIRIPLPVGMIHLGNFICIIGSFILGGPLGGLAGSIGMMMADISLGYGVASAIRTLILKFFMGLFSGLAFKKLINKGDKYKKINYYLFSFLLIAFIITLVISILSYQNVFVISYIKGEKEVVKTLVFHWIIPLMVGVTLVFSLVNIIFNKKLDKISSIALLSASIGIAFNIFGEVFIKTLIYYWLNASYQSIEASFMYSVSGLPSTLITSVITTILVPLIVYPIFKALRHTNQVKYLNICDESNLSYVSNDNANQYEGLNDKEND